MYVERLPDPAVSGRVAVLWVHVAEGDGRHLVVPDGCVDLIWGPHGPHVAGPDTGPMYTRMRAGDTYVGVRFLPGAVGGALGVPVEELRDLRVPVADLPRSDALRRMTEEGPGASRSELQRLMLATVVERLGATAAPDPAAPHVAAALRAGRTVAEVARRLGLSERQLHRRSLASFGYSPKTLQRIVRFQRALRLARAGRPLADVAADSGYADQAHLANDVKRLSGVTIRRLL
ncbi:helix-turn-helix transcriptional regulator [Nonomuraea longicatena]|uniref:Helix-turn-helix transcriptional regulator n=1 Tax=Nonomuraea longicatena TaxID=83682 RepID=A0ABN1QEI4_9ACTN